MRIIPLLKGYPLSPLHFLEISWTFPFPLHHHWTGGFAKGQIQGATPLQTGTEPTLCTPHLHMLSKAFSFLLGGCHLLRDALSQVRAQCHIVCSKLMGRVLVSRDCVEQKSLPFISSCNYRSQVDAVDGNRMVTLSEFVFNADSKGL